MARGTDKSTSAVHVILKMGVDNKQTFLFINVHWICGLSVAVAVSQGQYMKIRRYRYNWANFVA